MLKRAIREHGGCEKRGGAVERARLRIDCPSRRGLCFTWRGVQDNPADGAEHEAPEKCG